MPLNPGLQAYLLLYVELVSLGLVTVSLLVLIRDHVTLSQILALSCAVGRGWN